MTFTFRGRVWILFTETMGWPLIASGIWPRFDAPCALFRWWVIGPVVIQRMYHFRERPLTPIPPGADV